MLGVPRIVVVLPRGEAIRNFVYSHAVGMLSQAAGVTVLSVTPSAELEEAFASQPFAVRPLTHHPERYVVGVLRELLDMAHWRYLWSQAAQQRWRVRDDRARTPGLKLKHRVKKLISAPFANAAGLELLSGVERAASRCFRTTDEFLRFYREMRPDLVFNASHVHGLSAIQAVQAAQWLKIRTAAFIFSWDNLTSQGRVVPPYDYYLVWNENLREQLLRIYPRVRSDQVLVCGTPQFDFYFRPDFHWTREEFCARIDADPVRPLVLYTTGMAEYMPGEDRIVERIGDMLLGMTEFGPPQLMVRVYAKDRTGRFDRLRQSRKDILFPPVPWEPAFLTPKPEDLYWLTNTLRHCTVGINIASTISLELCIFDKPVINVGYDPPGMDIAPLSCARYYQFDHYAAVVASGAVEVAYSENELQRMLSGAFQNPDRLSAKRRGLMRKMFGDTLDGKSAQRVAELLLRLAENQRQPVP